MVCTPTLKNEFRTWSNKVATVYGWGRADLTDKDKYDFSPNDNYHANSFCLQRTFLQVLPQKECRKRWQEDRDAKMEALFKDHHMCASEPIRNHPWRWRDACQGDEGAPLTIKSKKGSSRNLLVGVFDWSLKHGWEKGERGEKGKWVEMCGGTEEQIRDGDKV